MTNLLTITVKYCKANKKCVVDATPEVFFSATSEVATPEVFFPRTRGQHLISADRVLYKDDEIVGPVMQSVIESASEPTSSASSDRNSWYIVCHCKLSWIRLVKLVVLYIKTTVGDPDEIFLTRHDTNSDRHVIRRRYTKNDSRRGQCSPTKTGKVTPPEVFSLEGIILSNAQC